MRTKKYFITKITAILLVIFLTFANVAQVSAAFRGSKMSVDFERVISVSDSTDEAPPVEDLAEPIDEIVEPVEEAPDAEIFAADTSWYGDGSATEFYIGTVDELEGLDQLVTGGTTFAGKTIYLTADLDLAGTTFAPIGASDKPFNGTFNGQNHTISNLAMNLGESGSYAGLFAHIGASGTANRAHFLNLYLSGFNVIAYNWVGGLAGRSSNALIDNIHIANSTVKSEQYAGGLIGHLTATDIKNSSANIVTVGSPGFDGYDQGHKMGGLGGLVNGGSLTAPRIFDNNIATNVNVTGYRECGGLFGMVGAHVWITNNTVTDSYIASSMSFAIPGYRGPWTGGLVGWANGDYSLYAGSEVSDNQIVSPVAGYQGDIVGGPFSNARFWDVYNTTKNDGAMTLAEAVNAADAGNTLKVLSRKVTETAPTNIDKALTIIGPNVGISAIDGARVSEYHIYGGTTITVNAASVTIDGLSFEGTRFNLLTPTNLRNNIYAPVNGDQYVIAVGSEAAGGADPLTAAYDLSGNAFTDNPDKRMIIHLPAEATDAQKTQMDGMFTALYPPIAAAKHLEGTANPYSYIAGIPPVANNDNYSTIGMAPLVVDAAAGVLSNDSFENPALMTASLVTTTPNGTLNLATDGSFTYTPNPTFSGEDSFTYKALAQGMESNIATVTITVYARPVISSADVQGPYFVGEQKEFHVTLDNTNGTNYTKLLAEIFVANIGLGDVASIEVLKPGTTDQWITLNPEEVSGGLKLVVGPTENYPIAPNQSITLTFRVKFNTAGNYTGTGTLYSHEGTEKIAIASLTATMNVVAKPFMNLYLPLILR